MSGRESDRQRNDTALERAGKEEPGGSWWLSLAISSRRCILYSRFGGPVLPLSVEPNGSFSTSYNSITAGSCTHNVSLATMERLLQSTQIGTLPV
jgi:hypothetical protein